MSVARIVCRRVRLALRPAYARYGISLSNNNRNPNFKLARNRHYAYVKNDQNYLVKNSALAKDEQNDNARLNVLIAYEDVASGQRAMRIFSDTARGIRDELHLQLWRFDVLETPDGRESAADDAVKADMLVIATSSEGGLPESIQDSLRAWLARKHGASAAVVALLGKDGIDSPRLQFMRGVAKEAGLDFFAPLPCREDSPKLAVEGIHRNGQEMFFPVAAEAFSHISPYQHGGLNE